MNFQRCQLREGRITLTTKLGEFTFCHPCAVHGGYGDVVKAVKDVSALEAMWKLDSEWVKEGQLLK